MRLYYLAAGFFYGLGGIFLIVFSEHLQVTTTGLYANLSTRTILGLFNVAIACLQFLSLRYGERQIFALITLFATSISAIFIASVVTYTSLFQQNNWGLPLNWWFIVLLHFSVFFMRLEASGMRQKLEVNNMRRIVRIIKRGDHE